MISTINRAYFCTLNLKTGLCKICIEVAKAAISGFLSLRRGASSDCGWRNGLQYSGKLRMY